MWIYAQTLWNRVKPDEAGQGQVEYGLLLTLAVLAAMLAVVGLGAAVYALWDDILIALPF